MRSDRTTVIKMTADRNEKRSLFMEPMSLFEDAPCKLPALQSGTDAGSVSPDRTNGRDAYDPLHGPPVRSRPICYREGELDGLELPGLEPVFDPVVVASSMIISATTFVSGSINRIRSGSFTNSRFFVSGT
jgi:hypothetical protein